MLARSLSVSAERGAWLALGIGLLLWGLGQTYYSIFLYYASPAPFPSPADAFFLAFYPASYVALGTPVAGACLAAGVHSSGSMG